MELVEGRTARQRATIVERGGAGVRHAGASRRGCISTQALGERVQCKLHHLTRLFETMNIQLLEPQRHWRVLTVQFSCTMVLILSTEESNPHTRPRILRREHNYTSSLRLVLPFYCHVLSFQRMKRELGDLEKQLVSARKQLETETLQRVDLQNRVQSMKEELDFRSQVYAQVCVLHVCPPAKNSLSLASRPPGKPICVCM